MMLMKHSNFKLNLNASGKLIFLAFLWMNCLGCNSQTDNCQETDNFKSEVIETYSAILSNDKFIITDDVPKFTDLYTYNSYGNL